MYYATYALITRLCRRVNELWQPPAAARIHCVSLKFVLDQGKLEEIEVAGPSGNREVDEAAVQALKDALQNFAWDQSVDRVVCCFVFEFHTIRNQPESVPNVSYLIYGLKSPVPFASGAIGRHNGDGKPFLANYARYTALHMIRIGDKMWSYDDEEWEKPAHVKITISADRKLLDAKIVTSSGSQKYDEAVLKALNECTLFPQLPTPGPRSVELLLEVCPYGGVHYEDCKGNYD